MSADEVTDALMRHAAFDHVRKLNETRDVITAEDLNQGFLFQGERIALINPRRGIFKPRQMKFLLSIKTVFPKPGNRVWYDDQREVHRQLFEAEETVDYAFTGTDPKSHSRAVEAIRMGAFDYLTKPFDLGELVARLHALLRRAAHSGEGSGAVTVGPLMVDPARRLVFVNGERADLTKREFDLLSVLAANAGVVLSRQRLLELVWGYDFDVDTNVADVFISYLRRKLERDGVPRVIHTVRGIGYVLRPEP